MTKKFARNKIPVMEISCSWKAAGQGHDWLKLGNDILPQVDSVDIHEVGLNSHLRSDSHFDRMRREASQNMTLLRPMRHLHDAECLRILYKAQVKPMTEYGLVAGISSGHCQISLLDKVQRRDKVLISGALPYKSRY